MKSIHGDKVTRKQRLMKNDDFTFPQALLTIAILLAIIFTVIWYAPVIQPTISHEQTEYCMSLFAEQESNPMFYWTQEDFNICNK